MVFRVRVVLVGEFIRSKLHMVYPEAMLSTPVNSGEPQGECKQALSDKLLPRLPSGHVLVAGDRRLDVWVVPTRDSKILGLV